MTLSSTPSAPAPTDELARGARWFLFLALASLAIGFLLLTARPQFVLGLQITPPTLAWLLLLIFGTGLSGVFGLTYAAIPRVCGRPLYSEKFVLLHYGFHLAGTLLTCAAVAWPEQIRGSLGATFLACGAVIFVINLTGVFRAPAEPDGCAACLSLAGLWLLALTLTGPPFAEQAPAEFLDGTSWSAAWLVMALGGVLFNTTAGLALRLLPATMGAPLVQTDRALGALVMTNMGLAFLTAAVAFGPPGFVAVAAGALLLGVLLFLGEYLSVLRQRTTPTLTWDVRIFVTAILLAPVAIAILLWAVWMRLSSAAATTPLAMDPSEGNLPAALPLAILPADEAVLLTTLLAVAIPAFVALAYQLLRINLPSREKPVGPTGLAEQILLATFFNYATGVLLLIPGAWAGIERLVGLGSLFLLAGALGFLGNFWWQGRRRINDYGRATSVRDAGHFLVSK